MFGECSPQTSENFLTGRLGTVSVRKKSHTHKIALPLQLLPSVIGALCGHLHAQDAESLRGSGSLQARPTTGRKAIVHDADRLFHAAPCKTGVVGCG